MPICIYCSGEVTREEFIKLFGYEPNKPGKYCICSVPKGIKIKDDQNASGQGNNYDPGQTRRRVHVH